MKTKFLGLLSIFLIGITTVFGQNKTEKFKVFGNCEMCESRIEKAALSVDGVAEADWDKESKILNLVFDESKTDAHKVQMAIANVGHDTEMHKAKDEVYNNLPGCCQYSRDNSKMEMNDKQEHKDHQKNGHSKCMNK